MKKQIIFVSSFLLLSLIPTSLLFSMNNPNTPNTADESTEIPSHLFASMTTFAEQKSEEVDQNITAAEMKHRYFMKDICEEIVQGIELKKTEMGDKSLIASTTNEAPLLKSQNVLKKSQSSSIKFKTPTAYPSLLASMMPTATPSCKGLDALPFVQQWGYQYGTHKAHDIIEYLFTNIKTDDTKNPEYPFDIHNETHLELLEQTFNYYMENSNTTEIITLLEKCQHTKRELQIEARIASKLYKYVSNKIKHEEAETHTILTEKNNSFIKDSNALIADLQEELSRYKALFELEAAKYHASSVDEFIKKADYIRILNEKAIAIRTLSPALKLSKKTCSDIIGQQHSKMTPMQAQKHIANVCNDVQLIKKIKLGEPLAQLQDNSIYLLEHIAAINAAVHSVALLK